MPHYQQNVYFQSIQDEQYEISSKETLKFDEIKIEKHDDLNDNIYKDNVSEVSFFININI